MASSRTESTRNLIHSSSSHKLRPRPVTVSGVSVASTTWLVCTFLIIIGLVVAAGFPQWTTINSPTTALQAINIETGLYYICYTPGLGQDSSVQPICSLYVYPEFSPSNRTNLASIDLSDIVYLFTSSICYGVGTCLIMISLIVGIVAYCKPRIKEKSIYLVAFVLQLFACKFNSVQCSILSIITNRSVPSCWDGSFSSYISF